MYKCGVYPARNGAVVVNDFYMPDDISIKSTANDIIKTLVRDSIEDRIVAAYNFIVLNDIYTPDKVQFGKDEWWQYPSETLGHIFTGDGSHKMYGDCEDTSFLLASLLIALGIPSENVRVGLSDVHAWVECKIGNSWYLFETTSGKSFSSFIPSSGVIGSSFMYTVNVYIYKDGCEYAR
jgi:transglutaminase-like putative cysteine protease